MKQRTFRCINVRQAEGLIHRNDVLVLDVRATDAFAKGHIKGARQVTIGNLSAVINSTARSHPILIYCYHGYASREFAQVFADFGFLQVYSLDGGYEAWGERPHAAGILDEALQQWLAKNGFSPDDVDGVIANGTTPLMRASHQGQSAVVRMLIAAGAQLDTRNADGNNALWLACVGSHLELIDLLIESGIDVDNRNDNGATALMYAASSGKANVVERLLWKGADTTPETLDGFTALDMAATAECLALLRRAEHKAGTSRAGLERSPLNP